MKTSIEWMIIICFALASGASTAGSMVLGPEDAPDGCWLDYPHCASIAPAALAGRQTFSGRVMAVTSESLCPGEEPYVALILQPRNAATTVTPEIFLAPADFLKGAGLGVVVGNLVEGTAVPAWDVSEPRELTALEIRVGESTLRLRGAGGRPLWQRANERTEQRADQHLHLNASR